MLARLAVRAPFVMAVPDQASFTLYTYEDSGYQVTARPPQRTDLPIHADIPDQIQLDGKAAFAADGLLIDFRRDTFDRKQGSPMDPAFDVIQRAINSLVTRLRYVTRAQQITPLSFPNASWRLTYLNDDETELKEEVGFVRGYGGRARSWSLVGTDADIWNSVHSLTPDWQSPVWDDILLDAFAALPKIGTAVVLAATALEVFISHILDDLAKGGTIPTDVWDWLNARGNWLKDPSTDEQFDFLMKHFLNHSLKESADLWTAFQHLRTARNTFVHEGRAVIGKVPVSLEQATRLVAKSNEIIGWVRQRLPAANQWVVFEHPITITIEFPVT
jgi:hypothetical protein